VLRKEGERLQGRCAPGARNRVGPRAPVPANSGWRVFAVMTDGPERRHFGAVPENQERKTRLQSSSQVLCSWGFC